MSYPVWCPSRLRALGLILAIVVGFTGCGAAQASSGLGSVKAELSPTLAERDSAHPFLRVIEPADGDHVTSPVRLVVELENAALAPKGRVRDGEGHLHVLVDQPCLTPGKVIPDTDLDIHIGSGAETVLLDLEPGEHRFCVQIGDGFHSATSIQTELAIFVDP